MAQPSRAEIDILLKARDELSSTLQKVQGELHNFQTQAEKANIKASALGTSLGYAGVQALSAFAGGVRDAIVSTIEFSSQLEQASLSFGTMLGSAELAEKTLQQLKDFAKTTPFEFPELLEASKRLMAYGTSAEDLIPTMTILGNIVAGVGKEKLPQLILAFGQVQAATKLTGAELRQFTEAGVPMLELLSKTMGKPVKAIQELVSEGKVGFKQVRDALASTSEEGGKFAGLMQKQAATFGGAMSNIKDSLRFAIADGFKPFFDILRAGALAIAAFLETDDFKTFAANVATAMQSAGAAIVTTGTFLFNLGRVIASNEPLVKGLAIAVAAYLTPAIWGAVAGTVAFIAPIVGAGIVLGTLAAAIAVVIDHWSLFEQAGAVIKRLFGDLVRTISGIVGPAFSALGSVVGMVVGWIQDRIADLVDTVGPLAEKLGMKLTGVNRAAIGMMPDIAGAFSGIAALAEQTVDSTGHVIGGLVDLAKQETATLGNVIAIGMDKLRQPIEMAGVEIKETAVKFSDASTAMGNAFEDVGEKAKGAAKKIKEVVEATQESILQAINAKHAYDEWREGMKALLAEGQIEAVAQEFINLGKTTQEAVQEILRMQDELDKTAREAMRDAEEAARKLNEELTELSRSSFEAGRQAEYLGATLKYQSDQYLISIGKEIDALEAKHAAILAVAEGQAAANRDIRQMEVSRENLANSVSQEAYSRVNRSIQQYQYELGFQLASQGFQGDALDEERSRLTDLWIAAQGGMTAMMQAAMPGYAHGGVVPGAMGAPQLAVVHGGETITPPGGAGITIQITGPIYGMDDFARQVEDAVTMAARRGGLAYFARA